MGYTNPTFSALTSLQTLVCCLWMGQAQYVHGESWGVGHGYCVCSILWHVGRNGFFACVVFAVFSPNT